MILTNKIEFDLKSSTNLLRFWAFEYSLIYLLVTINYITENGDRKHMKLIGSVAYKCYST